MIDALLYLQFHSIKNRLLMRIRRLKQPKYLLFALVGGAYFYFYFFRWIFMGGRGPRGWGGSGAPDLSAYETLGALVLFTIILLAWLIPHERAALVFTEAEIAFLFPAPISRRGLVHFKLLRSQTAILFTTVLLTLLTNRMGGVPWIRAVGWWLILSTLNLHFLGSSFARTLLLDRGISNWQRRLFVLVLVGGAIGGILIWAKRTMPSFSLAGIEDFDGIQQRFQQIMDSGPAPWLLLPFRLIVRPYTSPNAHAFLKAFAPALLLLALHYYWVFKSNVAFEEASIEASQRMVEKVAAMRAGNWQGRQPKAKRKRSPFKLRPVGPPAIALLWKNLISAGQIFTPRVWIVMASLGLVICFMVRENIATGAAPVLAMVAAMVLTWTLILGPQFLRQDFRQDLPRADMLKLYPMRGWQVALGELLAPASILIGIQWFLIILLTGIFLGTGFDVRISSRAVLAVAFGAAIAFPMLDLIILQIPNAAVLLFPSWFQSSKTGGQGIEVTGQRLVFMLCQLLAFVIALVPAGAAGAGVFFLCKMSLGLNTALLLAPIACSLVLAIEASLGIVVLGHLFDRFDLSAEVNA
jgi:ABC-2 type transport system permease protein